MVTNFTYGDHMDSKRDDICPFCGNIIISSNEGRICSFCGRIFEENIEYLSEERYYTAEQRIKGRIIYSNKPVEYLSFSAPKDYDVKKHYDIIMHLRSYSKHFDSDVIRLAESLLLRVLQKRRIKKSENDSLVLASIYVSSKLLHKYLPLSLILYIAKGKNSVSRYRMKKIYGYIKELQDVNKAQFPSPSLRYCVMRIFQLLSAPRNVISTFWKLYDFYTKKKPISIRDIPGLILASYIVINGKKNESIEHLACELSRMMYTSLLHTKRVANRIAKYYLAFL